MSRTEERRMTLYSMEPLRKWVRDKKRNGATNKVIADLLGWKKNTFQSNFDQREYLTLMEVARYSKVIGLKIEDWPLCEEEPRLRRLHEQRMQYVDLTDDERDEMLKKFSHGS